MVICNIHKILIFAIHHGLYFDNTYNEIKTYLMKNLLPYISKFKNVYYGGTFRHSHTV